MQNVTRREETTMNQVPIVPSNKMESQRGQTLPITLLISATLLSFGMALVYYLQRDSRTERQVTSGRRGELAADAGIERVMNFMQQPTGTTNQWDAVATPTGAALGQGTYGYHNFQFAWPDIPGVTYQVDVRDGDWLYWQPGTPTPVQDGGVARTVFIKASASGGLVKQVAAKLSSAAGAGPFSFAFFGSDVVGIHNHGQAANVTANIFANQRVDIMDNCTVTGNVICACATPAGGVGVNNSSAVGGGGAYGVNVGTGATISGYVWTVGGSGTGYTGSPPSPTTSPPAPQTRAFPQFDFPTLKNMAMSNAAPLPTTTMPPVYAATPYSSWNATNPTGTYFLSARDFANWVNGVWPTCTGSPTATPRAGTPTVTPIPSSVPQTIWNGAIYVEGVSYLTANGVFFLTPNPSTTPEIGFRLVYRTPSPPPTLTPQPTFNPLYVCDLYHGNWSALWGWDNHGASSSPDCGCPPVTYDLFLPSGVTQFQCFGTLAVKNSYTAGNLDATAYGMPVQIDIPSTWYASLGYPCIMVDGCAVSVTGGAMNLNGVIWANGECHFHHTNNTHPEDGPVSIVGCEIGRYVHVCNSFSFTYDPSVASTRGQLLNTSTVAFVVTGWRELPPGAPPLPTP